ETSRKRVPRSLRVLRDDAGDLGCLKRAWRGDILEAVCREGFCVRPNGGRRDRQGTAGLEGGMGAAPDMPELEQHAAAAGMDCTGHAFPACDLLCAVDTRRADIALALGRDLGCFRDDESGAGPLGVIQRAQQGGHVAGARAASSQGRHDNTVRQRERSYFDGGEEIPRGLSREVLHEAILLRREDVNGTTPPIAVTQPLTVRSNRDWSPAISVMDSRRFTSNFSRASKRKIALRETYYTAGFRRSLCRLLGHNLTKRH